MKPAALIACLSLLLASATATASQRPWVEIGGQRYSVELALDDRSRAQGLMYRAALPADQGMLFVHDRQDWQAYWMKNTRIPLDILYFSRDRRLVSQQRDVPPCSAGSACPPYPSRGPALYVLELNAGEAARLELVDGALLQFGPGIPAPD